MGGITSAPNQHLEKELGELDLKNLAYFHHF